MRLKINKKGNFKFSKKYIKLINDASVYDVAIKTPITFAPNLTAKEGNNIFLKREDLQPIFSFKNRGAFNRIINLSDKQKSHGIIAASAGNHAQGVALACRKLKIPCHIVMPLTVPENKLNAVKRHRAKVLLYGENLADALKKAKRICDEKEFTFVHPFDDPLTIAGQGTIGKEILEDDLVYDTVFVPVGGGGLLAGVSAWIKQHNKKVKIIGVEVDDSACLSAAIKYNKRVSLERVGLFADGVAVSQIGKNNLAVIKECVDEVMTVTIDEVCAAVKDIFEDTRVLSEPSGAVALAGLKIYSRRVKNKNLLAISSGANVNFQKLGFIVERSEIGENREKILSIKIPEKPGSFLKLAKIFSRLQITEFNYRKSNNKDAFVLVGIRTTSENNFEKLKLKLKKLHYDFKDYTNNQISNDHLRHMVGGRRKSPNKENVKERIFNGEFPEKPGALFNFLEGFGDKWNISLFHYRNIGSAYGNILIGIEDLNKDKGKLINHLDKCGTLFKEESNNGAYLDFLK